LAWREHDLGIRVAQVDYIYSNYNSVFQTTSKQWNSVRLSAGIVVGLGNYYVPNDDRSLVQFSRPTEVTEGEPVTVTATATNFNPKHTPLLRGRAMAASWTAADKQSARVDTTGVDGGQLHR
jgi:hypothetical protein